MALQHLRSSTANKRPTPGAMSDGQLGLNTNLASPGLFFKDSNGDLVKVGPVHVGTTAPNASPGAGGQAGNSVGEQWLDTSSSRYVFKIWDGTAWRTEDGEFVNTSGDVMTGALGIVAGAVTTPGLYFSGDTNTGIYSPGSDQVGISTNGSERARIDSSGRLLVGTSTARNVGVGFQAAIGSQLFIEQPSTGLTPATFLLNRNDTNGPRIVIGKSRGTAIGSNTIVANGDELARFDFAGADGTDLESLAAQIRVEVDGTPGANDMPGRLVFSTTADGASSPTERMRLTASGNVGIGLTAPNELLEVAGNIHVSGGDRSIFNRSNNALSLGANNVEHARISSNGLFGIGVTAPAYKIDVFRNASQEVARLRVGTATGLAGLLQLEKTRDNTTANTEIAVQDGDSIFRILSSGSDGTTQVISAAIAFNVDGAVSSGIVPGNIRLFTTNTAGANDERARLTNTGALLVGTTATPTNAGSGAVVAEDRVVVGSSAANQIIAATTSNTITGTTGTMAFKFKSAVTGNARSCYVKVAVSNRNTNSTPSNQPAAEYAFQLHMTSAAVCSINSTTTIFEHTYVRATHFAFADLGNGECTVTLTNPVATAHSLSAYKVEILGQGGNWTLDSVTVT